MGHLLLGVKNGGSAEINDFQNRVRSFLVQEQVLRLEVAVDDAVLVAVGNCAQNLFHKVSGNSLGEVLRLDDVVEELASADVLEDEMVVFLVFVELVESDDVGVIGLSEDVDFVEKLRLFSHVFGDFGLVYCFDCAFLPCGSVHGQTDRAEGA